MAETEREILTHYGVASLYPQAWPANKDDADEEDLDKPEAQAKARHTKRFTTLEHARGTKGKGRSPHKGRGGRDTDVPPLPRDEADPLGSSASIVSLLRRKGIPTDRDEELKSHFLLTSPYFSPSEYLNGVHDKTPHDELTQGLQALTASIDEKSAALKKLVEANFERYVRAKATIDNVYTEMRNHGGDERPGSRHSSWGNSLRTRHTQQTSFRFATPASAANEKRKNALVAESEYGIAGISEPLQEAAVRANEVWGPALGGRDREEHLKIVLKSIETNRAIFECGTSIEDCIRRRDYDSLTEEYSRAQRYRRDAQAIAGRATDHDVNVDDQQIYQVLITGRVLMETEKRIEEFKKDTWRRLSSAHFVTGLDAPDGRQEEYMELISVLMQLGVDENPIWVWLQSRHDYLHKRIQNSFEHVRVDLELQRRKMLLTSRASNAVLAEHLKTVADSRSFDSANSDTRPVITFWERLTSALTTLLSTKGGLLGEVIEYWETSLSFIEGIKQRSLPAGPDGRSRKFHRLEREEVKQLKTYAIELFNLVREQLQAMFIEAPIQDVTAMISGLGSNSPETPRTPGSAVMTPLKKARFTIHADSMPPLPTQTQANAAWDSFAFWPPNSNSLSSSTYLSRLNNLIGTAVCELASVPLVKEENANMVVTFRSLVGDIRERTISAICAAWIYDSEHSRELEDWSRALDKQDITTLPVRFSAFESTLLSNIQTIVHVPEAANHPGSRDVILPPPAKHIDAILKGFKNSLYKAFAVMMEHAQRASAGAAKEAETPAEEEDLTVPLRRDRSVGGQAEAPDTANDNARKLLTISNFQLLRSETIPALVKTFEDNFNLIITDDAKTLRDVLSQMHARVFQSYVRPTVEKLTKVAGNGIKATNYAPEKQRPTDAKPYVYDILLTMTHIHTEVSRTTPALTGQVLSYLFEQLSTSLIEAFKTRKYYNLLALMQATLDVEFLGQTLDPYLTKKAEGVQSDIYIALDERTDNDARIKLQNGLPEMRATLKRLRERTKGEFACFKKVKKSRAMREQKDGERAE